MEKLDLRLRQDGVRLPLSAQDLVEFTPPDAEGQEGAPVYLLRVPTYRIAARLEAAKARAGLRYPPDHQLLAELRRAVEAAVEDAQQPEILGLLDRFDALRAAGDPGHEDLLRTAAQVAQVEAQLAPVWPPLGDLLAERVMAIEMSLFLAAQHHLAGWRGEGLPPFEMENGIATAECLDRLPPGHVAAIGGRALALRRVDASAAKNSASPSRSSSRRPTSTAASRPRKEGRKAKRGSSSASASSATPSSS